MPRRLLPKNAFKRGIDERDPETIAWALLEQARLDYFPDEWVTDEVDEDGNPILAVPLMSINQMLKTVEMLERMQERKAKRGEDTTTKASGKAKDALEEWRKSVNKQKAVKKKL